MRIDEFDWTEVASSLDRQGWAILPGLLAADQCDAIAGMYGDSPAFRSHVVMARHGFGRGEYRYFSYPLPDLVQTLRTALYPKLAPIANRWHDRMQMAVQFPATLAEFLSDATTPASADLRRCFCNMVRATIIASIRTCTASMSSPCRWQHCFPSRSPRSRAASSC